METGEKALADNLIEMIVEIRNADGLHMRPAMQFVDTASRFKAEISVSNDLADVNGKSIMQMSMLAATCGSKLKIKAQGSDAKDAIDALQKLVEVDLFGEPAPADK